MRWLTALMAGLIVTISSHPISEEETDSDQSRKVLGSSVVTSVSVITDHGNGTKTYLGDPSETIGTPGGFLAPDRYEFYTFDESGDLVKRLMTLEQIQGLIAGGDSDGMEGDASAPTYYHEVLPDVEPSDLQGVHKVVANVQNVLKSELEASRNKLPMTKPLAVLSVPDAASSWSILLPGVIGGPLEDNKAPESETIIQFPSTATTTTTEEVEETTLHSTAMAVTTTENPTIIHYLPIKNIPPPPKKNTTYATSTPSKVVTSSSTSAKPITVPVASDTKSAVSEPTVESTSHTTLFNLPSSTSATSSETVPVLEEIASSLSSVLSQVVNDVNISNALDENYVPISSSSKNSGIPSGSETRTETTKIQYSTTTPTTAAVTKTNELKTEDKITTFKPPSTSTDKTQNKINQVKNSSDNKHFIKVTTQGVSSSTTEKVIPTTFEFVEGDVSDSQMISEALAAQNMAADAWILETKTSNRSDVITDSTESTQYATDVTSEMFPTETDMTEKAATNTLTTIVTTLKPFTLVKAKPTANKVTTNSENVKPSNVKQSNTKNNTKSSTKKPGTNSLIASATNHVTKTATSSKVQTTPSKLQASPSNTNTVTTNLDSTTTQPTAIASNQSIKISTTVKPIATHSTSSKTKPVNKKPISTKPANTIVPPSKIKQNETTQTSFQKVTSTQRPNIPVSFTTKSSITISSTTLLESAELREETTKATISFVPVAEKLISISTAATETPLPEEKMEITTSEISTSNSNNIVNKNQKIVASSTNKQVVTSNPTTENALDSTTNMDLENEGELLQEGISAVTSILLQENNMKPVPANKFAGNLNRQPVMGELKHATQINADDIVDSSAENKSDSSTLVDITTENLTSTTEEVDNESTTESDSRVKTDINTTENDITTTEYPFEGIESDTLSNEEGMSMTVNENTSTTINISAIEFTTPAYEETTIVDAVEKKTNDFELESGGQSTQVKESKLSPETNTSLDSEISPSPIERNNTSPVSNNDEVETHKLSNLIGNSTKIHNKESLVEGQSDGKISSKNNTYSSNSVNRPVLKKPSDLSTPVELDPAPHESLGLEASTSQLGDDVRRFADLCNELAFRMWTSITGKGSISARSLVLSPFAVTSLLAMVFLGARGPTSGQMNDVLRLDDMVTFNPHQVLQNVTESVLNSKNYGVATAAFIRELYSDKAKGKILDFYKERAQQYYDGHVEEVNFVAIGDVLRRRTNLLIKRQTLGRIPEYLRGSSLSLRSPLSAFSANIFQTDCELASTEGRDGEMYFVVRPSTRQRRLVPVPAAVWRSGFLAGYEPGLDATAVCLGADSIVSTLFVLPGQQGQIAPGDGLARLEQRLIETSYRRGGWSRLLRSLLVRPGLELQVPRFSHRSVLNVTGALQRMGLKDLFNAGKADLRGLNGLSNDLHLSDMVQINTFSTCAEDTVNARHHTETYPVSPQRMGREREDFNINPAEYLDFSHIPLALRPRQARLPDNPRLRFDRPFLYMVRHNPTGMILHMGRFNPRLLP